MPLTAFPTPPFMRSAEVQYLEERGLQEAARLLQQVPKAKDPQERLGAELLLNRPEGGKESKRNARFFVFKKNVRFAIEVLVLRYSSY